MATDLRLVSNVRGKYGRSEISMNSDLAVDEVANLCRRAFQHDEWFVHYSCADGFIVRLQNGRSLAYQTSWAVILIMSVGLAALWLAVYTKATGGVNVSVYFHSLGRGTAIRVVGLFAEDATARLQAEFSRRSDVLANATKQSQLTTDLKYLSDLHKSGALSDDEFTQAKSIYLNS